MGIGRSEVVYTKKTDLERILEHFNIQLENPIFWMSQDKSRQFLSDMKPSKMYEVCVSLPSPIPFSSRSSRARRN